MIEDAGRLMARNGARTFGAWPELEHADETFRTLRAWHFQARYGALLREHPDAFKQSLADNIRAGESLTGADVARAYERRTELAQRMRTLLHRLRRAGDAGLPGAAVPGRPGVPARDQRQAAGRPTSTGCDRPTSSPSPAARRSPSRPAPRPTGFRWACRSSPRTAPTGGCSRIAAAFEAARG